MVNMTGSDGKRREEEGPKWRLQPKPHWCSPLRRAIRWRSRPWWERIGVNCSCIAIGCWARSTMPKTWCKRPCCGHGRNARPSRARDRTGPGCTASPPICAWIRSPAFLDGPCHQTRTHRAIPHAFRHCGCGSRSGWNRSPMICSPISTVIRKTARSSANGSPWHFWWRSST